MVKFGEKGMIEVISTNKQANTAVENKYKKVQRIL